MADDLTSSDFFRDPELLEEPNAYYKAARERSRLWREPHHDVVMVTGYEEAVEIYNDNVNFSSATAVTGPFPGFPVPLEGDDVSDLIDQHRYELPFSDQLPVLDPPEHTAHRSLLMRLITPKRLKENEDAMWAMADKVLDEFLPAGEGEFISGFASPFTLLVIADLLGVPEEDRAAFAADMSTTGGLGSLEDDDHLAHSPLEKLYARFTGYIEDRRANPREDVLTGLATATFPDGSLPEVKDAVAVAANLFAAGQETTVRLLSASLQILGDDPELQRRLRDDPDLIANFIEEALRMESPIKGDFRLARRTVEIGGEKLPGGTTVMVMNAAANRDPRRFDDPERFDVERANARQHLAFGRGIHTCPGAPLARAEGRAGIKRLLERTTDIRISEERHGPPDNRNYRYLPTFILRGLTHLNLEWDLAEGEAR